MLNILNIRGRQTSLSRVLTPQWMVSSVGNFTTNLLPAFSSEEFRGRIRHTTLMPHSSAGVVIFHLDNTESWSWILIMPNYSSTRYTFTSHYHNKRIEDLGKFHQIIEVCYNILWNTYPGMFSDLVVRKGRSLTLAYVYGSRPKSSYNVCYTFHNQCQKWCMVEDDVIYRSQIILSTLALEIVRAQEKHRKTFWHNEISGFKTSRTKDCRKNKQQCIDFTKERLLAI